MKGFCSALAFVLLFALSSCGGQEETSGRESSSSKGIQGSRLQSEVSDSDRLPNRDSSLSATGSSAAGLVGMAKGVNVWLGVLIMKRGSGITVLSVIQKVPDIALQQGDVIEAINGSAVASPEKLKASYDAMKVGKQVKLRVRRAGEIQRLAFSKPEASEVPQLRVETETTYID